MQTRIKNGRTITVENNLVSVYDADGTMLNSKTFGDSLKALIVFKTL